MSEAHTLDQLLPGQKAHVKKVGSSGAVHRRLLDMGIVRGVEIELLKPDGTRTSTTDDLTASLA